jgi:hypothetical protein
MEFSCSLLNFVVAVHYFKFYCSITYKRTYNFSMFTLQSLHTPELGRGARGAGFCEGRRGSPRFGRGEGGEEGVVSIHFWTSRWELILAHRTH